MKFARITSLAIGLSLFGSVALADPLNSMTDFSNGDGGWTGFNPAEPFPGEGTWVDGSHGSTGAGLRSVLPASFWAEWFNNTNPQVIGDYTKGGGFTIGLDIKADSILNLELFSEVQRDVFVELRDYDNTQNGLPYTSVYYKLGTIGAGIDWQHLSVTVTSPNSATLPEGWGGYGGVDADGNPTLPSGTTFADVLKGVDEITFTTAEHGWFYGYTYYDVSLDNISVTAVPEPSTLLMQTFGLAALVGVARRRVNRRN